MSNKRILNATAGGLPPRFPAKLELFQRLYETRRSRNHPITAERLREFSEDLKMISLHERTSFEDDWTTDDGTRWMSVGFTYMSGRHYKLAFPKDEDPAHRDGTVSGQHVALYCDDDPTDVELDYVAQAAFAIFKTFVA